MKQKWKLDFYVHFVWNQKDKKKLKHFTFFFSFISIAMAMIMIVIFIFNEVVKKPFRLEFLFYSSLLPQKSNFYLFISVIVEFVEFFYFVPKFFFFLSLLTYYKIHLNKKKATHSYLFYYLRLHQVCHEEFIVFLLRRSLSEILRCNCTLFHINFQ